MGDGKHVWRGTEADRDEMFYRMAQLLAAIATACALQLVLLVVLLVEARRG